MKARLACIRPDLSSVGACLERAEFAGCSWRRLAFFTDTHGGVTSVVASGLPLMSTVLKPLSLIVAARRSGTGAGRIKPLLRSGFTALECDNTRMKKIQPKLTSQGQVSVAVALRKTRSFTRGWGLAWRPHGAGLSASLTSVRAHAAVRLSTRLSTRVLPRSRLVRHRPPP